MRRWMVGGLVLWTVAAEAQPQPTLVAPRAALVDPNLGDKLLMSKKPDSKALQGSIAKLMTAYTASWAVRKGHVAWSDTVTFSKRAVVQGCTCTKFKSQPNTPPATGCSASSTTQEGEQFRLDDLVRVTLNQSTGESTDAIAELVARKVYKLPAAKTKAESDHLMDLFIGLMNKRSKELHLDNSTWITVHGGDTCDFSEGCDASCTPTACNPKDCGECNGGTTVRDLALLWHALVRDEPKFLGLIGVRAFELKKKDGTIYNSYRHGYTYYPGLDGDKNGGSGRCPAGTGSTSASCHIAQATRGGHPLIAVVLQAFQGANQVASGVTDITAMLRWGFAKVLKPERRIDATLPDVIKDYAVACSQGQCFTALRAKDDKLALVAWNSSPDSALLTKLASSTDPAAAYPSVTALDVDANMMGVQVAVITGGKVVVARWWLTGGPSPPPPLPPNVKVTFLGDGGTVKGGTGTLVRLRQAGDLLAATAVRNADGTLRLASWKLGGGSPGATAVTWLADGTSPSAPNIGASGELVLATGPDPASAGNFLVVTGTVNAAGAAALQLWRMNGTSGAFTYVQSQALGSGRNLSLANHGVGKFGVSFTVGSAATGAPRVEVWDVSHDGAFTRTLGWSETEVATATAIAPLGPPAAKSGITAATTLSISKNTYTAASCGANSAPSTVASQGAAAAFLTAARRSSGAQLAVWDAPKHYNETSGPLTDYRIVDSGSAWGSADNIRLAVLPSSDALLNQYVTGQLGADGKLKLIGWRVGSATPFVPTLSK